MTNLTNTPDPYPETSAKDRSTKNDPSAPRDPDQSKSPLTNHRATPRQATSAVAYTADPPSTDDPLLDFAPVPHVAPRRNSITPELQRAIIAHLAATGIVTSAAKHIGKSMEAIYKLRQRPGAEGFNAAWEEALQWGVLRLEDCAIERAIHEGLSNKRANSLLAFILTYRRQKMIDVRELEPGMPYYEYLRDKIIEDLPPCACEQDRPSTQL